MHSQIRPGKGQSKDYQTLCLNQSELKHMHAIRPYCSREQQRKSTRRQATRNQQSPYEMSRSNSKRLDNSSRKSEERSKVGKQTSEMLGELIKLKSEYKLLKANYSKILEEKRAEAGREMQARKQAQEEAERKGKEVERWQKSATLLEQEMDRMRKECARVVEMERFKAKKLEQTLQEKQLMIAYLRNQLQCIKRQADPSGVISNNSNTNNSMQQPLFFLQNSAPMLNYSYFKPNLSLLSSIPADPPRTSFPEEDSLCLSRDRSKEADSIIHSLLSNDPSLHPLQQRPLRQPALHSLEESPIEPGIQPISQKSEQSQMDFKKGKEPSGFLQAAVPSKSKPNPKKLQILIADENLDTQNIPSQGLRDELSMETKKRKGHSNSLVMCKQKKKLTAKKINPF